jgi:electron transport complex protein RnfB
MKDVYHELREHMDQFGTGFNATESGVEIKILKKIFTEEEARLYLCCTVKLEPTAVIAQRAGREVEEVASVLAHMTRKGLLYSGHKGERGRTEEYYAAAPYLPGIWEFQTHTMDDELAALSKEYFLKGFRRRGRFLRVVPVNEAVNVTSLVAPYDDVKGSIEGADRILLAPCACTVSAQKSGAVIDQPTEVCILFGFHADQFAEKGIGRWISRDEALEVLQRCQEIGLVARPTDTVDVGGICNCGKFCGGLMALRAFPRPSELVGSNYFSDVDASLCSGCGSCIERCPMNALKMSEDQVAVADRVRCIGCGLCVSACPTGALTLHLKPEGERHTPGPNQVLRSGMEYTKDMGQPG